jgi:hypothetical protein
MDSVSYEVVELIAPARAIAVIADTTTWEEYPDAWRWPAR